MNLLTIGKLAAAAEVGIDTVRFYERAGLLRKPQRTAAGYRLYAAEDARRMRFIRRAKALGFSLEEVRGLLQINDRGDRRGAVRALARKRLEEIEQRLAELARMRDTLHALVHQCHGEGSLKGCPIIEAVLEETPAKAHRVCGAKAASSPWPATASTTRRAGTGPGRPRDGHRHRRGDGVRRHPAGERRSARHRESPAAVAP